MPNKPIEGDNLPDLFDKIITVHHAERDAIMLMSGMAIVLIAFFVYVWVSVL